MLYKEGIGHKDTVDLVLKLLVEENEKKLVSEWERIIGPKKLTPSSKRAVYCCEVDTDGS